MQCRVSAVWVLRCIEQLFFLCLLFAFGALWNSGSPTVPLCGLGGPRCGRLLSTIMICSLYESVCWMRGWFKRLQKTSNYILFYAILRNFILFCELGDLYYMATFLWPGLLQLQGALCCRPQHQESTWRVGGLWTLRFLMTSPAEIAARRMDWWEHVRRCRRRAQARPVKWPRTWLSRLPVVRARKTFKLCFLSFILINLVGVDKLRCLPFQFRPCCFHHLSDTRQSIIPLRGERTRESSWALNGSPVQARLESSIIKVASFGFADSSMKLLHRSTHESLGQVKAVLRRRGTSAKQLFALQATFHC